MGEREKQEKCLQWVAGSDIFHNGSSDMCQWWICGNGRLRKRGEFEEKGIRASGLFFFFFFLPRGVCVCVLVVVVWYGMVCHSWFSFLFFFSVFFSLVCFLRVLVFSPLCWQLGGDGPFWPFSATCA